MGTLEDVLNKNYIDESINGDDSENYIDESINGDDSENYDEQDDNSNESIPFYLPNVNQNEKTNTQSSLINLSNENLNNVVKQQSTSASTGMPSNTSTEDEPYFGYNQQKANIDELKKRGNIIDEEISAYKNNPRNDTFDVNKVLEDWKTNNKPILDNLLSQLQKPTEHITLEQAKKAQNASAITDALSGLAELFAHGQGARIRNNQQPTNQQQTNAKIKQLQDIYEQKMANYGNEKAKMTYQSQNQAISQTKAQQIANNSSKYARINDLIRQRGAIDRLITNTENNIALRKQQKDVGNRLNDAQEIREKQYKTANNIRLQSLQIMRDNLKLKKEINTGNVNQRNTKMYVDNYNKLLNNRTNLLYAYNAAKGAFKEDIKSMLDEIDKQIKENQSFYNSKLTNGGNKRE